ncbi:MAG: translation initiation factor IF-2 subunit beta [Nanoarchaeota archaeon]
MEQYTQLLSRARSKLPESVIEKERFEIPKAIGHIEGNKTVVSNFNKIIDVIRRPADHLLKYLQKELAAPGVIRGDLLILGSKVPSSRINDKIRQYAEEFVLCLECGKPDTTMQQEGANFCLKCQACGNKRNLKQLF